VLVIKFYGSQACRITNSFVKLLPRALSWDRADLMTFHAREEEAELEGYNASLVRRGELLFDTDFYRNGAEN